MVDYTKQNDPTNTSNSTQENNNDYSDGNLNQNLVLDRSRGGNFSKGVKGSSRNDTNSEGSFKSLQFKDTFGKMCASYLKIKSDMIKHTDYTYLHAGITFTISPDPDIVRKHCVVFAVNTMNQAIDGYRITGRRDYTDQVRLISEVYFYSFYKGLIATWNGVQNGTSIRSLLFRGHAFSYRLAREGRRMYVDSTGPTVVRSIKFTSEQISSIKETFEKEFLIAKVADQSLDIDGNFVIPAFENILNRMSTGAFKLQGKNQLQVMDDSDTFPHNTLLSPSTCPLGNTFYNGSKSNLLVTIDTETKIKDFSYIMNKASFITFDSYYDDYTENDSNPPEFVTPVTLNDNDYLVQDEIKYITGLDCLPQLNQNQYPSSFYPRKGNDLFNRWNIKDFGYFDMFRSPDTNTESVN